MKSRLLVLAVMATMPALAQSNSEQTVLTIDDKTVSIGEFERLYMKNNTQATFDSASLADYMKLFIDYKLKVAEAEQLGMDTTQEFRDEFDNYCAQLEKPYFTDSKVDDSLAYEAYEHMKWDVRASHILIKCGPNASAADTSEAYKRIEGIRKRALKGEDFSKLALETSEDQSVSRNKGDLGFFTAFSMIYEFEKMAYSTKVGDISPIFRTRFGYHILKVTDRRQNPGQIRAAHILVRVEPKGDESQQKTASDKIKMISDSLAAGADWAKTVSRYSEDRSTRTRQGDLQWFSTGTMVSEFETAAFALKNIGDISEPVKTSYGWHIIKLLDKKPINSYENIQEQIRKRLSRDIRSQMAQKAVIERLKREYKFTEDKAAYDEFVCTVDTSVWTGTWNADRAKNLNKAIFTIADTVKFTQHDYAELLSHRGPVQKKIPVEIMLKDDYEKLVENSIMNYERKQLANKYPEFNYLRTEYHDGILLFALMDKMVWTKASTDSAGLEKFYEANKQNYMWGDRMEIAICVYNEKAFSGADKKKADAKIVAAMKAGAKNGDYETKIKDAIQKMGVHPDSIGIGGIVKKYTIVDGKDTDVNGHSIDVKYCDVDGTKINEKDWGKNKSKIANIGGRTYIYYLVKRLPPMPKTLDECRGTVIADYQTQLEADWQDLLRSKHTVRIDESVLNSIIKR